MSGTAIMSKSELGQSPSGKAWMGWVLRGAAVYNLVWGAIAGLAPTWHLQWLGIAAPDGVACALWQCVGMVIGCYGIGYWCAARDPLRHWPITLVGLIGKVAGPIGFVFTASQGVLPWSFGKAIATNDVIWWVPFGMILLAAWKAARGK
jgi:hypothetical protein